MSSPSASELRLSASKREAFDAVMAALPEDAVVREEDDGVGRFAGERIVALVGIGKRRISLFEGTWGAVKVRIERPQLDVVFGPDSDRATVRLVAAPEQAPSVVSHVSDALGQMVTVAALVVAYHFVRSIPIDYALVAGIAVVGGLAWTVVARLVPSKPKPSLEGMVRDALAPLVADERDDADEGRPPAT